MSSRKTTWILPAVLGFAAAFVVGAAAQTVGSDDSPWMTGTHSGGGYGMGGGMGGGGHGGHMGDHPPGDCHNGTYNGTHQPGSGQGPYGPGVPAPDEPAQVRMRLSSLAPFQE